MLAPVIDLRGADVGIPGIFCTSSKEADQETTQKTTQKIPQKTIQRILDILSTDPSAGRRFIAEKLGDITEDGVKYQLNKMKSDGQIEHIGPAKGGHRRIIK